MFSDRRAVSQIGFVWIVAGLATCLGSSAARAAGYVRFDTSSFMFRSDSQPNATSSVLLGPEFSTENDWISAALDIKGVAFLSNMSSFTVEAGNLYIATSPQWMPHHQITLGRRIYDWNEMEDRWDLGIWSARFLWNPLSPERIGMTGAFYSYQSQKWRLMVFGTPISPPERSFPIRDEGGRLAADSRDFPVPYEELELLNRTIPINYSIVYPSVSSLLFRPGASAQIRYGEPEGPWGSVSYGMMPLHEVQMAVDAHINPQSNRVDAIIHPVTLFHHLATAETGYRGKKWSIWGSVTGETPILPTIPSNWQLSPMGPSLLSAVGWEIKLDETFTVSSSYLNVDENAPPAAPGEVPLNLPSRFQYKRAVQMEGSWTGIPEVVATAHWTYDIANLSGIVSLDLTYQPVVKRSGVLHAMFGGLGAWTFGVGGDVITSATAKGYIGEFVGNDRVRGRVSYAF